MMFLSIVVPIVLHCDVVEHTLLFGLWLMLRFRVRVMANVKI